MLIEIGHVEAIVRYPVKSMGGERLEVACVRSFIFDRVMRKSLELPKAPAGRLR